MKAKLKPFRIKFYARTSVVGLLAAVGVVALAGEPAEGSNFLTVLAAQATVWGACWGTAWWLAKRWGLTRVLTLIHIQQYNN